MSLFVCESCGRHVRAGSELCPFCDAPFSRGLAIAAKVVAVAATVTIGLSLSACYGGPPRADNLRDGASASSSPDSASSSPSSAASSGDASGDTSGDK